MKVKLYAGCLALVLLLALTGCLSMALSEGPVVSFIFSAAANRDLDTDVVGLINKRGNPKSIHLVVPPGTDVSALVATVSVSTESTITVVSSGPRVIQENGRTPNDFTAPVTYSIEVAGDKEPWTYRVSVREAETNAKLSMLAVRGAPALTPEFLPEGFAYRVEVQYATEVIFVEATGQSRYLKSISVADQIYRGGRVSAPIPFLGDEMIVVVESTAEDGVSKTEYTVTVTRGEPDRNAFLGSMLVAESLAFPLFDFTEFSYGVTVPYETTMLTLSAKTQSPYAALSIIPAGQKAITADHTGESATLIGFGNLNRLSILFEVTAQSGDQQRYSLEIFRAAPDDNNELTILSVQGAQLTPSFRSGRFTYRVVVPFNTNALTVRAVPRSPVATVVLERGNTAIGYNGNPAIGDGVILSYPDTNPFSLSIVVIAQNGDVRRYAVQITKSIPDGNANLGTLSATAGRITPSLSSRVLTYTIAVPADKEQIIVTAEAASPVAMVSIMENPKIQPRRELNVAYQLQPGEKRTITLMVRAESGAVRRYQVTMMRPRS